MINPAIGSATGVGQRIAGGVDRYTKDQSYNYPTSHQSELSEVSYQQFLYPYRNIKQKIKADKEAKRKLLQDINEQKIKAEADLQLQQDSIKNIDEALYSDIEGEPLSRFTYAEIQQMRRKQYEKGNKCQSDPSIILLESDLIKEAKFMDQLNKK
ncbi:MAG: hypothetical protein EZS28_047094 [Streblomastix strix]|uniref:Uncharacterized protein n=1 Tax=Streblomastix strix TaxID=222440 RepID=A0A5J4TGY0_9EUKA|nr:MAG: hypothetical protein EZS28_047094 [Streblomastix strix]